MAFEQQFWIMLKKKKSTANCSFCVSEDKLGSLWLHKFRKYKLKSINSFSTSFDLHVYRPLIFSYTTKRAWNYFAFRLVYWHDWRWLNSMDFDQVLALPVRICLLYCVVTQSYFVEATMWPLHMPLQAIESHQIIFYSIFCGG